MSHNDEADSIISHDAIPSVEIPGDLADTDPGIFAVTMAAGYKLTGVYEGDTLIVSPAAAVFPGDLVVYQFGDGRIGAGYAKEVAHIIISYVDTDGQVLALSALVRPLGKVVLVKRDRDGKALEPISHRDIITGRRAECH